MAALKEMHEARDPKEPWGEKAAREGDEARYAGIALADCPYPVKGILSRQWRAAWNAVNRQLSAEQRRNADRIDGMDRDDLGESPDF